MEGGLTGRPVRKLSEHIILINVKNIFYQLFFEENFKHHPLNWKLILLVIKTFNS